MKRTIALALAASVLCSGAGAKPAKSPPKSPLASLHRVATVSDRYLSYNIEMVEVTGGRFWAPYGFGNDRYRMRPAVNLADPSLLAFARQLGPTYLRVSGTWANTTYLPAKDETVTTPPEGYNQVLSREAWRGVVAFAKATNARIVTSFPAGPGARNADGSWNPEQAQRLVDLTREAGGSIYGAELFNEPTIPTHGGFPKDYTAADYSRDFRIFRAWAKKSAPDLKISGTGGTAEGTMMKDGTATQGVGLIRSEDLLKLDPNSLDIFTYHFYGNVSQRCGSGPGLKDEALTAAWLNRTLTDEAYYHGLRDKYAPGKPLWLNETAQAACGGSPWASTYLDTFRFLNQLGVLAQKGVQVVAHNTLDASDYGMIDHDTGVPRPNYWAAVLWKRTMGTTVLAAPKSPSPDLRLFAHCLRGQPGGVGLLAINTGTSDQTLGVGAGALGWTITGEPIDTRNIKINGLTPGIDTRSNLTNLGGTPVAGSLSVPAQSIAFVAVRNAGNGACK